MSSANIKENDGALENAQEIIERFGGIRPMATKMDVPVTTVQGWKKRNIIPENRRADVLAAAQSHDIDLSGILGKDVANENSGPDSFTQAMETARAEQTHADIRHHQEAIESGRDIINEQTSVSYDAMMKKYEALQKQAARNAWLAVILFVGAIGLSAILLWPAKKQVAEHGREIAALKDKTGRLEGDVKELHKEQFSLKNLIPENMQQVIDDLTRDAAEARATVETLRQSAASIKDGVLAEDAGSLPERIAVLEQEVAKLAGPDSGFSTLLARVHGLQQSVEGQQQLSRSFADLQEIVMGLQETLSAEQETSAADQALLEEALAGAARQDGALAQTLEGVSPSDMKAAAMLLALTQFRQSLNRDSQPFEGDLALLRKLVGDSDPELAMAIERLAPKAKEGVLSSQGLSNELKALAGDIVVASLEGEDISVKEKAKARLNEIIQVEKDGELITGTDTQATVARAQKLLDQGDVQGAIAELQSLEGSAAQKAQPLIDEAEYTLMAQQLQEMLSVDLLSRLQGQGGAPLMINGQSLKSITSDLKASIPAGTLYRDEESGVSILKPAVKMPEAPKLEMKAK